MVLKRIAARVSCEILPLSWYAFHSVNAEATIRAIGASSQLLTLEFVPQMITLNRVYPVHL